MQVGLADAKQLHANELIHRDHHACNNQDDNDPAPTQLLMLTPLNMSGGKQPSQEVGKTPTVCMRRQAHPKRATDGYRSGGEDRAVGSAKTGDRAEGPHHSRRAEWALLLWSRSMSSISCSTFAHGAADSQLPGACGVCDQRC